MIEKLQQDGFALVRGLVNLHDVNDLSQAIAPQATASCSAGVRGLAGKVPAIGLLAQTHNIRQPVDIILDPSARLVRSILFRKDAQVNWHVNWHQDVTIAVDGTTDDPQYSAWSTKERVTHVQPPLSVLQRMLTVRIHLDVTDEDNGALCVIPGSHRMGRIAASEVATVAKDAEQTICRAQPGDALLFHPLLVHASHKASSDRPRRIIHLEYCDAPLAQGLSWVDAA